MASPDLPSASGAPLSELAARRREPQIIDLPTSFDLGAFLSEEDSTASVSPAPPAEAVHVGPVALATAGEREIQRSSLATPTVHDAASRPSIEVAARIEPDRDPEKFLTLLQVLEAGGHFSWQEAVAIVQQLCVQLKDVPSHAPVLIEPGAIQVTAAGQLHLIASQQGGDPLVIQLGRLLRSMLSTEVIPSELRLLISQATFELAIFDSVDQFARALAQISGPADSDSVKAAFRRASHAPIAQVARPRAEAVVVSRPMLPEPAQRASRTPRMRRAFDVPAFVARVGVIAAVIAGVAFAALRQSRDSGVVSPLPTVAQEISSPVAPPPTQESVASARTERHVDTASTGGVSNVEPSAQLPLRGPRHFARSEARPTAESASPTVPPATSPSPPLDSGIPTRTASPSDLVHEASALLREGRASDAGIRLDLLVITSPLYQPGVGELTPEGSTAFHMSQRLLLPNIAARELEKATGALNNGDVDRALVLGNRVATMLDRSDVDSSSPLRLKLEQLLRRAGAAQKLAENTVYGLTDTDVIPPQPLSRQFPEGLPSGVPPQRVGTLELVVGKEGDVEFVKLYTPLNRYHERMIVSAVKAWRYRPALKAGKPVRFRLTISINLPESGNGSGVP